MVEFGKFWGVSMSVVVVDYGMGNLRSVSKALERVGANVQVSSNPKDVISAKALVLPGVGAFKDAVLNLKRLNLWDAIKDFLDSGRPFLGICLGLQLLFEVSYEFGETEGLGFFKGKVVKFELPKGYKIPHMGWNQVFKNKDSKLFKGIKNGEFFYFVHSYHVLPKKKQDTLAESDYGYKFACAVSKGNVFALQFHPEKSQRAGLKLLENFVEIIHESP